MSINKWIVLGVICILPALAQAANNRQNYLGLGVGLASAGGYSDSGYAFLFQMQQDPHSAIGFAYHQSDIITFTYKHYVGPYGNSAFLEGGMLALTYYDYYYPMFGVGADLPLGNSNILSLTAGTAFGDTGTAFVGRAAIMFEF